MSALHDALLAWMQQHIETALLAALTVSTTNVPASGMDAIQNKVQSAMATLADIQSLLAAETNGEARVLAVLQSQAATISTLQTQLAAASAASDPASIAQVVSQMQTNVDHLNAAINALAPATPPQPTDPSVVSGDVIPPGKPVIS